MFSFLNKKKTKLSDVKPSIETMAPSAYNEPFEQLADMLIQDEILCEMPLYKELDCTQLDYSVKSLTFIDAYLSAIRNSPPEPVDMHRVTIRVGAYVGEVIRRNTTKDMNWLSFDEAAKISTMVAKLGNQPATAAVLWTKPFGITFPLAKIQKYIQNGSEDSTRMFAEVMIEKA